MLARTALTLQEKEAGDDGKVVSALLSAIIMVVALGAGMEVANQAGIFWGLIVAVVVVLFGLMALVGWMIRPPKS